MGGPRPSLARIGDVVVHRSRINGILIDCNTDDIDAAAHFWAEALGRPVDPDHPGTRGNYRMLATPEGEISVQIQRVEHDSRIHLDIETDDIPAEVERLQKLGATIDTQMERWVVMRAPSGQRFCVVRVQRDGFSKDAISWE
jgi:predicted enzyme related to lactoylglutathione lyase